MRVVYQHSLVMVFQHANIILLSDAQTFRSVGRDLCYRAARTIHCLSFG